MMRFLLPVLTIAAVLTSPGYAQERAVTPMAAPARYPVGEGDVAAALGLDPELALAVDFGASDSDCYSVFISPASGFPRDGEAYLVMSNGFARVALDPNDSDETSGELQGLVTPGGGNDLCQLVLELRVPEGETAFSFDFKFLSEEFPEYVGGEFNDGFLVELGESTFTVSGTQIIAPNNVVFDEKGELLSINTTGALGFSAQSAFETTYDGATRVLTTSVEIPGGAETITLTFSIFDVGDDIVDSAVFLDNVGFGGRGGGTGVTDNTPPVCFGSAEGGGVTGRATDSVKDDPDNTGIAEVSLSGKNLRLTVTDPPNFPPPTPPFPQEVTFDVTWTDPTQDASGVVTVSDDGSNTCSLTVEFLAAAIELEAPGTATMGNDYAMSITFAGFTPTVAELRYRPSGTVEYDSVPLSESGSGYEGRVPAAALTLRGFDYYIVFSDGERTVTLPAEEPTLNPLHVRVGIDRQVAGISIPTDAAYRMVSVPAVLSDPSPIAVFGDNFGDYGPTSWRLLRWLPREARYAEFPDIGASVTPGTAFWLAAYADPEVGTFDVQGGLSVDASAPAEVTLQPGWNQIGNPFAFPVAWSAVEGNEGMQPPALYDGVEYLVNQAVLDPWAGYFVFNGTGEPATLQVPPVEAISVGRPGESDAGGYRLHLHADVPERGLRDTQNVLGFAEAAEAGRLDLAEPPPIGLHLRLSAVEDGVRLAHSLRPTGGDGADWELEVAATPDLLRAGPLVVRVALEEHGARPTGYELYLLDLDRTAPLPMEEMGFEVTLRADAPLRRFRLIAGTEAYAESARQGIPLVPLDFALAPAYPNPFAGSATLAYQVAERTDVVLEVFDVLGRRVAVLADGSHDAGRYTVQWDGTVAGAPLASGVYVYRLRAGGFTESQKMMLVR